MAKHRAVEGVRLLSEKPRSAGYLGAYVSLDGLHFAEVWVGTGYVPPEPPIHYIVAYCPETFNVVDAQHRTKVGWSACARNSLGRLRSIINPALEAAVTRGAFNTLRSGERVA